MKTNYEKQMVVYEFLNCLSDNYRKHWHHTIENTYNDLTKEQFIKDYCIVSRDITSNEYYNFIKL